MMVSKFFVIMACYLMLHTIVAMSVIAEYHQIHTIRYRATTGAILREECIGTYEAVLRFKIPADEQFINGRLNSEGCSVDIVEDSVKVTFISASQIDFEIPLKIQNTNTFCNDVVKVEFEYNKLSIMTVDTNNCTNIAGAWNETAFKDGDLCSFEKKTAGVGGTKYCSVPTVSIPSRSYSVVYGGNINIPCRVTAFPFQSAVEWRRMTNGLTTTLIISGRYSGATINKPSLTISNAMQTDRGSYVCSATNEAGKGNSSPTTLYVEGDGASNTVENNGAEFFAAGFGSALGLVLLTGIGLLVFFKTRRGDSKGKDETYATIDTYAKSDKPYDELKRKTNDATTDRTAVGRIFQNESTSQTHPMDSRQKEEQNKPTMDGGNAEYQDIHI